MSAEIYKNSYQVKLREVRATDFDFLHELLSHPNSTLYHLKTPNTHDETRRFLSHCISSQNQPRRKDYQLISYNNWGEAVGTVNITITSEFHKEAEIGFYISPKLQKNGWGTHSLLALEHMAFHHLKLHRLFALISPENLASQKLLEKLKYTKEGVLNKNKRIFDKWQDSILYSKIKSDDF